MTTVDDEQHQKAQAGADHPLRSLIGTVYLPAAAYGVGQGAAAPVMVLAALNLGAMPALAGLTVALIGLGQVVGDTCSGQIVARLGERRSIIVASSLAAVGSLTCLVSPTIWILCAGIFAVGLANAVWGLARQNYLSLSVPFAWRARAMSLFGGAMRFGFFVGPLLGAAAIVAIGTRGGFVVQLIAIVVAGSLMARLADPPGAGAVASPLSLSTICRDHARLFATLGTGSLLLGIARSTRDAILPLWANHIGLSPATSSLLFGVGAAADVLCAYPAGHLMDRFGRTSVAVPSIVVLAVGYLILPFTATVITFTVVAIVLGVGNGFGNGVIMTIGADVAPPTGRAEFLAVWRLTHDAGFLAGPLSISLAAALFPLATAVFTVAGISGIGAGVLAKYVPAYTKRPARLTS
ncbi:putative major facilitator superfamily transporter [Gordonia effusa NBRC 100432]|uniref:Putative major facilitator superfamily transporter n=1 Tax=Gordonia effusa NBRC 100432 TaxID=1077974 RepID=H0R5F1_9ACTN|nr:MFS transporter [Gordonia effusa]GAB20302.1 putative major facilitator superfamily transporter [Gordonia effusa NBRC 100432]